MSVATRNPFALLDAEDASRPSTPPTSAKTATQSSSAPTRGTQKTRGGPASRGGKYYPRGGARSSGNPNQPLAEEPVTENQRKTEGGFRGRGGREGRGGGRGGTGARGGRRPFDRHSQTGKTDSDKKVHQGWGGDEGTTELKAEEAAANDAAAEGNAWGATATDAANAWASPDATAAPEGAEGARDDKAEGRPRREREPEEEDTTLTLDQYLAQKKEQDDNLPKIGGTRQANDGAGDDLWKDAVVLSKTEEDESYFVGKTRNAPKSRSKKEEKVFIEIDGRFDRPERGGRGRGRGGDRGRGGGGDRGRGRGGPRGPGPRQSNAANVDVADETAFPSLS